MLKYNICFIRRGDEILLLNREKPSWMGCWNGIGGKLERDEQPRESMIREIKEETAISAYELHFKGMVTWSGGGGNFGGMYAYMAEVDGHFSYETPLKTNEGILDWKKIGWILDEHNIGIVSNVPKALLAMLQDKGCYDHHCIYDNGQLTRYKPSPIPADLEFDDKKREKYFQKYTALTGAVK